MWYSIFLNYIFSSLFMTIYSRNVIQNLSKLFLYFHHCSWVYHQLQTMSYNICQNFHFLCSCSYPEAIWYNIFLKTIYTFSSLFMTISSRRPNGVYIRAGRSINLCFRSQTISYFLSNVLLHINSNHNLCCERNKSKCYQPRKMSWKDSDVKKGTKKGLMCVKEKLWKHLWRGAF